MRIAVAVATTGRRDTVELTAPCWKTQTRGYDRLVFSLAAEGDLGPVARALPKAEVIVGPKGSVAQRNHVLEYLNADSDLIVFTDDDYVPSKRFLAVAESIFLANPTLAILTGDVVADGINTQGIAFEDAVKIIAEKDAASDAADCSIVDASHAYGCNMVVRPSIRPDLRFDERLPLYGWLEDLDFSRRMARYGQVRRAHNLLGVHMGVKAGRTVGVRLGYSQVANPMYFVGKGTMPIGEATLQIARNVTANVVKSIKPEPWIDRTGRLRGNLLAFADALKGRQRPERITEL